MTNSLFERLLYEEEGTLLDFKKHQYRFANASDHEKSELLKDILGFANAWRRSESYILIGVGDVRGGRGEVLGIEASDHLEDHAIQQFVNNLTSRPVLFHYEAFGYEGRQVGIVRIEEQPRPIYIKKDYGKLKKNEVYVRRGSSTDPTKPATPDEVASMNTQLGAAGQEPSLSVQFAAVGREQLLGVRAEWTAEYCKMPFSESIPEHRERPVSIQLPFGMKPHLADLISHSRLDVSLNSTFYHELADFLFFERLVQRVRLAVVNTGEVPATEVRLEIYSRPGQGFGIVKNSDVPKVPRRRRSIYDLPNLGNLNMRGAFRRAGSIEIDQTEDGTKLVVDCGNLQPGLQLWTDVFHMAVLCSNEIGLGGMLYAANLRKPKECTLTLDAAVNQTALTVEELVSLGDQFQESDEE